MSSVTLIETSEEKGIHYPYPTIFDRDTEQGYVVTQDDIDNNRLFRVVDIGDGTTATYQPEGTAGLGNYTWAKITATVDSEIFVTDDLDISGTVVDGKQTWGFDEESGETFRRIAATGLFKSNNDFLAKVFNVDLVTNNLLEAQALPFGSKVLLYDNPNGINGVLEKRDNTGYILINDLGSRQPQPYQTFGINIIGSVTLPTTTYQGVDTTYTVSVQNVGIQQADNVDMVFTLDPSLTFISTTQGAEAAGVITFNAGNLAAGASASFDVVVTPVSHGTISSGLVTTTTSVDENPADNDYALITDVWIEAMSFDTSSTGTILANIDTVDQLAHWDFGDGNTSQLLSPSHDFGGLAGTKTVRAWASSETNLIGVASLLSLATAVSIAPNAASLEVIDLTTNAALATDISSYSNYTGLKDIGVGATSVTGNVTALANLPLERFRAANVTTLTGSLNGLAASADLFYLYIPNSSGMTINLSLFSTSPALKTLSLQSVGAGVTGSIAGLTGSPLLDTMALNNSAATGDLSAFTGSPLIRTINVSDTSGFTYGTGGAAALWNNIKLFRAHNAGWDTATVDRVLADFASNIANFQQTGIAIRLVGNAAPTGGNANPDLVALEAAGVIVTNAT